jgi:hypothetical protein
LAVLSPVAVGEEFLDGFLDVFISFAGALLNPANDFVLLAFSVLQIVVGELGPFLFEHALDDVPVALISSVVIINVSLVCFFSAVSVTAKVDGVGCRFAGSGKMFARRSAEQQNHHDDYEQQTGRAAADVERAGKNGRE